MDIIPKKCAKCEKYTNFPNYQHQQHNEKLPILPYCMKCYLFINISKWSCDNCKAMGTHRIHNVGFIHRYLILRGRKNAYKICQCKNKVELQQQ